MHNTVIEVNMEVTPTLQLTISKLAIYIRPYALHCHRTFWSSCVVLFIKPPFTGLDLFVCRSHRVKQTVKAYIWILACGLGSDELGWHGAYNHCRRAEDLT